MASQLDDPLAHMSLAYRYKLALNGLPKDGILQTGMCCALYLGILSTHTVCKHLKQWLRTISYSRTQCMK